MQCQCVHAAYPLKHVHPSSKLIAAHLQAARSVLCRPSAPISTIYNKHVAIVAAIRSSCASEAKRQHCRVWASQQQQPEPLRENPDEAADDEYEHGEYDEGEWEEYEQGEWEEYEEWEEREEGEEVEAEGGTVAVVSTARQIPADATSVSYTQVSNQCLERYIRLPCDSYEATITCKSSQKAAAISSKLFASACICDRALYSHTRHTACGSLCLQDDFVEVGLISRAHGVKGEVKVQLITDEPKKRLGIAGKRSVRYTAETSQQVHGVCHGICRRYLHLIHQQLSRQ